MERNTLQPGGRLAGYEIEAIEREDADCLVLLARGEDGARMLHLAAHAPGSVAAVRFLERTRRLAAVRHPHLVRVYEARAFEERPGAVAAVPQGQRLDRVLRDGPLPLPEAVGLTRQLAAAADALEAAGAELPAFDPRRIWAGDAGAQLDALEAGASLAGPRSPSAAADLAELLVRLGGDPPPAIAKIVRRARDGAYLSAGRLADDLAALPRRPRWLRRS